MVRVIVTPNYYRGTLGAPQEGWVKDEDGEIREWETKEDAEAWVEGQESGVYIFNHGEAERPKYTIMGEDETYGDDCYNAVEILGTICEHGQLIAREDIPELIANQLDRANVDYYDSGSDYDVYTYTTDNGYTIAFCPRTIALEMHDDLGNLNWDYPAYYRSEGF